MVSHDHVVDDNRTQHKHTIDRKLCAFLACARVYICMYIYIYIYIIIVVINMLIYIAYDTHVDRLGRRLTALRQHGMSQSCLVL